MLKLILILIISFIFVNAQEHDNREDYFIYPHKYENNKSLNFMGLSAAKLPEEVVEQDFVYRTPLLFYKIKYGLFQRLTAEAGIESNLVTYHFSLGTKYNYNYKNFGAAIGADAAYWFGTLQSDGFDSQMTGVFIYPNLTFGYAFKKFSVSLKGDLHLLVSNTIKTANIKISNDYRLLNGISFGVYVEQPLWKDNVIMLGFRSIFTRLYYPTWIAFPTFDKRYYITEAVAALEL